MPSTNLKLLEARFQALEEREKKVNKQSHHHRWSSRFVRRDPDPEQPFLGPSAAAADGDAGGGTLPSVLARDALEQTERFQGYRQDTELASKQIQGNYAANIVAMKQRATAFFERDQQFRKTHLAPSYHSSGTGSEGGDVTFVTSVAMDDRRADKLRDELHFAALFDRGGTPTPNAMNAPAASDSEENRLQNEIITRMMCSDAQAAAMMGQHDHSSSVVSGGENRRPSSASASVTAAAAARRDDTTDQTAKTLRSTLLPGRPHSAHASAFSNQSPIHVRVGSASSKRRPQTAVKGNLNGERLAAEFFRTLPPVIPHTGVAAHAKRMASRLGDVTAGPSSDVEPSMPPRPPTSTSERTRKAVLSIPAFAMLPDYYILQVKIVHAAASLQHWEFTVVVTDVTVPGVRPKHTFRGLKVNPQRYLIFQPPDSVVLNPLKQLPWASSPANLYGHTLRLEAFATKPVSAKVVDTMVHYGHRSGEDEP